ncbi:SAM-dependent methyltransferase [Actinoalloteichus caeruleus]|uniref:SAM-dependent methyltransferase n=1 Tax=Actinoalloteichus cyanogriseus TaxID=2893586 RepID=UPI0004ABC905|nr:SAM-dependent methyltransferase [Actinoalloteichus caeruleus]
MLDWELAWSRALYGPNGFFARGERPDGHFRTSPLVGPAFAEAVVTLLDRVDHALGRPARVDFVDVGAGGGELAEEVRERAPSRLADRVVVTAVDVAPSPACRVPGVVWRSTPPRRVVGLVVANEWLDAVPCPVLVRRGGRWRRVGVDSAGRESVLDPVDAAVRAWLGRWWPIGRRARGGAELRAEAGTPRDRAWTSVVRGVRAGVAVAVDYHHRLADRLAGRVDAGTLAGYLRGRRVAPIPDGSRDLTAHVALDACAAAVHAGVGGPLRTTLTTQRRVLADLGVVRAAPSPSLAATDPFGWLDAAARSGGVAELTSPEGLGGFGWLVHEVALPVRVLASGDRSPVH